MRTVYGLSCSPPSPCPHLKSLHQPDSWIFQNGECAQLLEKKTEPWRDICVMELRKADKRKERTVAKEDLGI